MQVSRGRTFGTTQVQTTVGSINTKNLIFELSFKLVQVVVTMCSVTCLIVSFLDYASCVEAVLGFALLRVFDMEPNEWNLGQPWKRGLKG